MTLIINGAEWRMTPFAMYCNNVKVEDIPLYVTYQFGLAIAGEALL
jgi:hypothetical protein